MTDLEATTELQLDFITCRWINGSSIKIIACYIM
jgi:hypothetical protein